MADVLGENIYLGFEVNESTAQSIVNCSILKTKTPLGLI